MFRGHLAEFGDSVLARVDRDRATRMEHTARRRVHRAGHVAGQDDAFALSLDQRIGNRDGGQKRSRVRVERVVVEFVAVRDLDDVAEVHHGDAVADVADDRKVVSDEQVGQPELLLQVFEQVDDLSLNRNVQRRNRLVADDEARVNCQRPSDADSLTLPAAELVGVAIGHVRVQPYGLQQLRHAIVVLAFSGGQLVDRERLADDVAAGHPRVQGTVRVLEDDLHLTAHGAHSAGVEIVEPLAIEHHVAGGGFVELENAPAGSG